MANQRRRRIGGGQRESGITLGRYSSEAQHERAQAYLSGLQRTLDLDPGASVRDERLEAPRSYMIGDLRVFGESGYES